MKRVFKQLVIFSIVTGINMIKIMSFNIRYGTAPDGRQRWAKRKKLVIERIRSHDPDLIGMQECRDDEQAAFIQAELKDYVFYGAPRGGKSEPAQEMAPILIKKDKFEILEQGIFWLSLTPQIPASQSWDSLFPRTVTWAKLRTVTGQEFLFANTHFDLRPLTIVESAAQLDKWLATGPLPFVLTGDFNALKSSSVYRRLLSSGRMDAVPGDAITFHGYGDKTMAAAIDWIITSPEIKASESGVDTTRKGRLYPSDHYPIYARLNFR
jgi:endonuclease/exonuclease/phosphatase family metal-dependent hydrolase